MAMYTNVNGASKLLAQTSAEAGVTELTSETTETFNRSGIYYTGYKRSITFPSDYKEAEILVYGKNLYTLSSTEYLRFGFTLRGIILRATCYF